MNSSRHSLPSNNHTTRFDRRRDAASGGGLYRKVPLTDINEEGEGATFLASNNSISSSPFGGGKRWIVLSILIVIVVTLLVSWNADAAAAAGNSNKSDTTTTMTTTISTTTLATTTASSLEESPIAGAATTTSVTASSSSGMMSNDDNDESVSTLSSSSSFSTPATTAATTFHDSETAATASSDSSNTGVLVDSSSSSGNNNHDTATTSSLLLKHHRNVTNQTQYYYLHIPKTGGYTITKKLRRDGILVHQMGVGRRNPLKEQYETIVREFPHDRVFMTEQGFNQYQPQHAMVMFRNPASHVVSQYFHCTESREHQPSKQYMPATLLEWLQAWRDIQQTQTLQEAHNVSFLKYHWSDPTFRCYNPLNFQSWLTTFPETTQDLTALFDVVGVMDDLEKSYCLFLEQLLLTVPPRCDCTHGLPATFVQQEHKHVSDHGVQHHGSSYDLTNEQQAVLDEITQQDQRLYQLAQRVFEERVQQVEQAYEVKLCGKDEE